MLRLGGPEPHGRRSGVVHILTDSEHEALDRARTVASLLGNQGALDLDAVARRRPRRRCCRRTRSAPTTCTRWSRASSTRARRRSCTSAGRPNIVTALGRIGGRTVGVVANNPLRLGGCLDSASAEKAARFVRMCDAFGVPLVVAGRRPRLPPRRRAGVGRRRTAWREAAARVQRVLGAARHAGDPQDLRRRLHRDERPLARRHPGLRLAGRRGRGHGRGRRGPDPAPPQARSRSPPTSARRSRPSSPPSTSGSPAASKAARDRRRRRDRHPRPDPHRHRAAPSPTPSPPARRPRRPRQHPALGPAPACRCALVE